MTGQKTGDLVSSATGQKNPRPLLNLKMRLVAPFGVRDLLPVPLAFFRSEPQGSPLSNVRIEVQRRRAAVLYLPVASVGMCS